LLLAVFRGLQIDDLTIDNVQPSICLACGFADRAQERKYVPLVIQLLSNRLMPLQLLDALPHLGDFVEHRLRWPTLSGNRFELLAELVILADLVPSRRPGRSQYGAQHQAPLRNSPAKQRLSTKGGWQQVDRYFHAALHANVERANAAPNRAE
jgi:hypothetical protein